MTRPLFLLVALVLAAAAFATPSQAQSNAAASRERELLRRAQAALRDVTAERDALRAELAALKARSDSLASAAESARADAAALRPQLARSRDEAVALRAELEAVRAGFASETAQAQAQAAGREAALAQRLAVAEGERDERTAANQALSALLARRSAALRDAERRNDELHAIGRTLVERWRLKTPAEAMLATEPLTGLGAVRAEDQAERWRLELDALNRPAAGS